MGNKLSKRVFHGKLLLFGEYSVIYGSKALVTPYSSVSARLDFRDENTDIRVFGVSNAALQEFALYLDGILSNQPGMSSFNIGAFNQDIRKGLYFRSTIPSNYGLGSSGALCAAVYDEYGPGKNRDTASMENSEIQSVRSSLALMESFFHSRSSGVDPLCIYFDDTIIAEGTEYVRFLKPDEKLNAEIGVFLIDTGQTCNTGDLVKDFDRKMSEQGLKEGFIKQYIPFVNQTVEQYVAGLATMEELMNLSVFQWMDFQAMIPGDYHPVWQYGLDSEYYACKLCGSGGGGYILCFTEDYERARAVLGEKFNIEPILIRL